MASLQKTICVRLRETELNMLKARGRRLGIGMNEVVRNLIKSPLTNDVLTLKLQPLFEAAELYKASLETLAKYGSSLNEDQQSEIKIKAQDLRRKLLAEIDLLRSLSELGRLSLRRG